MQKLIFTCFFIYILFCCLIANADDKYGADFLRYLTSAESNGIGKSSVAYSVGARALNNNPAGLAFSDGNELIIGSYSTPRISATIMKENTSEIWEDYGKFVVEPTEMAYINYIFPSSKIGNIGISFAFNHEGRFIRVNKEGKATNAFPKDDFLLGLGYSIKLVNGFAIGFDVKNIRNKVPIDEGNDIGRTWATNIGLIHQINDKTKIGVSLQNIGKRLSFKTEDMPDKLRRNFYLGGSYNIIDSKKSKLYTSFDVNPPFDNGLQYAIGAEFIYADLIALRLGYIRDIQPYYDMFLNINDYTSIKESRLWIHKGITMGIGIKLRSADANIAIMPSRNPDLSNDEKLRLDNQKPVVSLSFSTRF
jgi:hypothetical protein